MNKKILITGGAGFIGTNATAYYLEKGLKVIVYDNLSRKGVVQNLSWLKKLKEAKKNLVFVKGDLRNEKTLEKTFKKYRPGLVLHLAAQVAMTTSVEDPHYDFEVNALGTFNVLEAIRKFTPQASAIYSSTNKVFGETAGVEVVEGEKRYSYKDIKGISETFPLDFHGPYGCSKGAGDQYFRDYARIFGLKTVVLRQSGIYGPHQFGIVDQGWLAWICNSLVFNRPMTIFGNGKQVRDVLFVEDVLKGYDVVFENIEKTKGQIYNIGGGPDFTLSIWELFEIVEKISLKKIRYGFDKWRPGDQKVYISDISKIKKDTGWKPTVSPEDGVRKLYSWIMENKKSIKEADVFAR